MVLSSFFRMLMPRPISQVCCGCSAVVGVYFILALNLLVNTLFVIAVIYHVIYLDKSFSFTGGNLPVETSVAGFMLAGAPFIAAGFLGVFTKTEALVRTYWYYLVLLYVIILIWTVHSFAIPMCMGCPHTSALSKFGVGSSFTCGIVRIINVICTIVFVAIPLDLVLIVLSHADHLAFELPIDLSAIRTTRNMNSFTKPWLDRHHRVQVEGHLFKFTSASYGSAYEPQIDGFGGSRRIFNGTFHETTYPLGGV
uniref:Uncharacterized protein n=1 Tax=Pyrodinium bahamense TaxID=73915 RepID=A0A7S0BCS5_9DINO|mmetsp:Transcript_9294/g.26113  ORF Transcript_9294/g.26113 Transcript_9294/m.26113 type:complete len:253 (+) Transcript_9294:77-835(+)|eukprot:CAMPEP_0179073386 /NCGR_PEP_ID=MMETSP0796-20121207/32543_1 /TAXON_ID=73915 /ORGANISM="Pyrodinium bahamense, Strain pbaha01" /LENGTH=252 /DNA_ID=CAMNT_0020770575 /DNA_START=65 /DNA_END=823 /DNA_ORIENTATION=+